MLKMAWWNFKTNIDNIDESIKSFANKGESTLTDKQIENRTGEGYEALNYIEGYGNTSVSSFNLFYNNYINKRFETEVQKIREYRNMAQTSEVADVIEDATNESVNTDENGESIYLEIRDKDLQENENIINNLNTEFKKLFYDKIQINEILWDLFWNYMIDGRVFYERIINKANPSNGIIGLKRLPAESMDYFLNPQTGDIVKFFQYLGNKRNFTSIEEAEKDKGIVVFEPQQISFINYGIYGSSKYDILGYLDKAKIPYNQLKLLETSVVIYRLVRSPERFVFRIDTGNMPLPKAMAFVEKVKQKMNKKQTYDPSSGRLSQEPEILNLLENFYLPQCLDLDTIINLADGRKLTLNEIIDEYYQGKFNQVYSVNQTTGEKVIGDIKWAGVTRRNATLIRVHLENGSYEDCTPDHKFCVWKDSSKTEVIEVQAQNLTEDMDIVD